jgi:hypothetical protein
LAAAIAAFICLIFSTVSGGNHKPYIVLAGRCAAGGAALLRRLRFWGGGALDDESGGVDSAFEVAFCGSAMIQN